MKKKIYLVCQRHLITIGRKRFWSEFYPVSQHSAFYSDEDARAFIGKLLKQAVEFNFENIDYTYKIMFLE